MSLEQELGTFPLEKETPLMGHRPIRKLTEILTIPHSIQSLKKAFDCTYTLIDVRGFYDL